MRCYSFSQLSDLRDCPRRAVFDRMHPKPQTVPLEVGSLCHELAARVFDALKAMPERTEKECRRVAARELLAVSAKATCAEARKDFEEIAIEWLDSKPSLEHWNTKGWAEKRFAFTADWTPCAWDSPLARFRGIIDILWIDGDEAEVADYKSMRKPVADWSQLEIYGACLLKAAPDLASVRMRIELMRYCFSYVEMRKRQDLVNVLPNLEREMAHADQVLETYQLTGEVKATPNAHCGSCAHWADCPALLELEQSGAIAPPTTVAEAQRLAARKTLHASAVDHIQTYISAWVESHGAIPLEHGKEIRIVPSQTLEIDAGDAFVWALEQGVDEDDIWPLLSLTKKNAEKLAAKAGSDLKDIAKVGHFVPGASVRQVNSR